MDYVEYKEHTNRVNTQLQHSSKHDSENERQETRKNQVITSALCSQH